MAVAADAAQKTPEAPTRSRPVGEGMAGHGGGSGGAPTVICLRCLGRSRALHVGLGSKQLFSRNLLPTAGIYNSSSSPLPAAQACPRPPRSAHVKPNVPRYTVCIRVSASPLRHATHTRPRPRPACAHTHRVGMADRSGLARSIDSTPRRIQSRTISAARDSPPCMPPSQLPHQTRPQITHHTHANSLHACHCARARPTTHIPRHPAPPRYENRSDSP